MQNPLISIVIPAFNRANIIGETLDSICAQTFVNWECIIVDDGSTDQTEAVVAAYMKQDSRFQFISRFKDRLKGPSSCRNIGIEKSVGNYILFLDSDDLISSDCLENRINFVNQNPDYDFYIYKTDTFYDSNFEVTKPFNASFQNFSDTEYLHLFLDGQFPFCVMGPLWRKETLQLLGGFDEHLQILEDPDLHLRAFLFAMKSRTNYLGTADSFYRLPQQTFGPVKYDYKKVATNNYTYFAKHLVRDEKKVKLYALSSFRKRILIHSKANFNTVWKFYVLLLKHNVFTSKQIIFFPIPLLYIVLGINTVKGLGFYKIVQSIYK